MNQSGNNFPPCFNLDNFHRTSVVQANAPFVAELHTAMESAIADGENRTNLPPFMASFTNDHARLLTKMLARQELSPCLGAFVRKLKDQIRDEEEEEEVETAGRIKHVA